MHKHCQDDKILTAWASLETCHVFIAVNPVFDPKNQLEVVTALKLALDALKDVQSPEGHFLERYRTLVQEHESTEHLIDALYPHNHSIRGWEIKRLAQTEKASYPLTR